MTANNDDFIADPFGRQLNLDKPDKEHWRLFEEPADFQPWSEVPLLLVGPMVRKVTANRAYFFIATKRQVRAKILIHEGDFCNHGSLDTSDQARFNPESQPKQNDVELRPIGVNLFVGLLGVTLPSGAHGAIYSYDLALTLPDRHEDPSIPNGPEMQCRLNDLGLLGNSIGQKFEEFGDTIQVNVPLGYNVGQLPTFITPPDEVEHLRLVQASCRKPHGNTNHPMEPDSLPIVDEIIGRTVLDDYQTNDSVPPGGLYDAYGNAINDPPAETPPSDMHNKVDPAAQTTGDRPHQLIMTGDQIYADDVAPAMLDAIMHYNRAMMGWEEYLPGILPNVNDFMIAPGWRDKYLVMCGLKTPTPKGGTNYDQSHLLRFQEWCGMYLMAWSPALWPRTQDGTKVTLRKQFPYWAFSPAIDALKLGQNANKLYGYLNKILSPTGDTNLSEFVLNEAEKFVKKKVLGTPTRAAKKILKRFEKSQNERRQRWHATRLQAIHFGSTVPYVRRVIANTPTYMMFDDHEITDDWFINKSVSDKLRGLSPPEGDFWPQHIGPRLMRNGLSAYAIFQHWGNRPEDFAGWTQNQALEVDRTAEPDIPNSVGDQLLGLWKPVPGTGEVAAVRPKLGGPHEDEPLSSGDVNTPDNTNASSETNPYLNSWYWLPDLAGNEAFDLFNLTGQPAIDATTPPANADANWLNDAWQAHPDTKAADDLLRISNDPPNPALRDSYTDFPAFRWDYYIEFASHDLLVLDSRTWRAFPEPDQASIPSNISNGENDGADSAISSTVAHLRTMGLLLETGNNTITRVTGSLLNTASYILQPLNGPVEDQNSFEAQVQTQWGAMQLYGTYLRSFCDYTLSGTPGWDDAVAILNQLDAHLQHISDSSNVSENGSSNPLFIGRPIPQTDEDFIALASAVTDDVAMDYSFRWIGNCNANAHSILRELGEYLRDVSLGSRLAAAKALISLLEKVTSLIVNQHRPFGGETDLAQLLRQSNPSLVQSLTSVVTSAGDKARSDFFFRDGSAFLAPELISESALAWMLTDVINNRSANKHLFMVSTAPIFAHDSVDLVQRGLVVGNTALGDLGGEVWDFESWNANPIGYENLMRAAKGLEFVVVLSGDVHYAYSSVNRAILRAHDVDTTFVQLVASSSKNSDSMMKMIGAIAWMLWEGDIFNYVMNFNIKTALDDSWQIIDSDEPNLGPVSFTESFVGSTWEGFLAWATDMGQAYHLDDALKMQEEFYQIRSEDDCKKWFQTWFINPLLSVVRDLGQNVDDYARLAYEWVYAAPFHTIALWKTAAFWKTLEVYQSIRRASLDPGKAIFGNYLFARDILVQQASDMYKLAGVDPAYSLRVSKELLADCQGVERLALYGARTRYDPIKAPNTLISANLNQTHVVGSSNVGFVRVEDLGGQKFIRHDLCFYPVIKHPLDKPSPAPMGSQPPPVNVGEVAAFSQPRSDWMVTRHVAPVTRGPVPLAPCGPLDPDTMPPVEPVGYSRV